ncbi:hypothetical protein GCM10027615_45340 [Plantactinospora veratri]
MMPGGVRRAASDLQGDLLLAAALVGTITAVLLAVEPLLWHPFVVPVALCGVLVGVDVAAWLRRRLDIFDPRAMLGLLGFHFFFLAPLLHVMLDYWPAMVQPPTSWRDALGAMAVLNCIGLLLYRIVLVLPAYRQRRAGARGSGWTRSGWCGSWPSPWRSGCWPSVSRSSCSAGSAAI